MVNLTNDLLFRACITNIINYPKYTYIYIYAYIDELKSKKNIQWLGYVKTLTTSTP